MDTAIHNTAERQIDFVRRDSAVDPSRDKRGCVFQYGRRVSSAERPCKKTLMDHLWCNCCGLYTGNNRVLAMSRRNSSIFLPRKFRRRKMNWIVQVLITLSFLLLCDAKSSPKGAPPMVDRARQKITATFGERVSLPCRVEADSPSLVTWTFNGNRITSKARIKVGPMLKIRNVRVEDAGRYVCTATNSYGTVNKEIHLIVIDERGRASPTKPRFIKSSKMMNIQIAKPPGSSARLRCAASGNPTPQIEWFKDDVLIRPIVPSTRPVWTYKIRDLKRNDSGIYKCKVWNSEGAISFSYQVEVIEPFREKPVLLEPHPMNTTVQVGGMTAIQCRVQSRVEPTVKWIKRLDNTSIASYKGNLPENIITIDGRHYLILPTQEMLSLPDDSYLNKLVIRGATETHAGMYICLAANTMGYNYKYAYLNVVSGPLNSSRSNHSTRVRILPGSRTRNAGSSSTLPVKIAVPAGIGLLLVLFVAWLFHRHKERRLKSESENGIMSRSNRLSTIGSSETKSSTRSLPQEYEANPEEENNNAELLTHSYRTGRNPVNNYYVLNPRVPPTVGTPLLTVTEPEDSEYKSQPTDDDTYYHLPEAPPCSEITSPCSTEKGLHIQLGAPPPPPPSQRSASSLSSYPMPNPYRHHYHYVHPHGNSRRHHHHHSHHSRRGHHHY